MEYGPNSASSETKKGINLHRRLHCFLLSDYVMSDVMSDVMSKFKIRTSDLFSVDLSLLLLLLLSG